MGTRFWIGIALIIAVGACKKSAKQDTPAPEAADSGRPMVMVMPSSSLLDAGAPSSSAAVIVPPRPIPKPGTMIEDNAPRETTMRARAYFFSMRAARPGDAPLDQAFGKEIVEKLKPVGLAMDKGTADKEKWNRTSLPEKSHQIDLLMSDGCDAKVPATALERVKTPLATLLAHGIVAVRCHDKKLQCLQSTRDPEDVLCMSKPRHDDEDD